MKIRAAVEAAKDSGILVMARTDCRPTAGIDEAVARIAMYVEEGADILFLDSPKDEEEVRRAVAASAGRPHFAVLSPGSPRETPSQARAALRRSRPAVRKPRGRSRPRPSAMCWAMALMTRRRSGSSRRGDFVPGENCGHGGLTAMTREPGRCGPPRLLAVLRNRCCSAAWW
jgi:hypothetical protein